MNEDLNEEGEIVLQWCHACGEGYSNFCRALMGKDRVPYSLCLMKPKKEDNESNN